MYLSNTDYSNKCSCVQCHEVYPIKGINSHYIRKHTDEGRARTAERAAKYKITKVTKNQIAYEARISEYLKNPKHCKQCSNEIQYHLRMNMFCSKSCAASYNNSKKSHSELTKKKISESLKSSQIAEQHRNKIYSKHGEKKSKTCPVCSSVFSFRGKRTKQIYCSRNCYRIDSKHQYRKVGDRKGDSNRITYGKSGYYRGIFSASTYELCWIIYALDHNIKFTRFPGYLQGNNFRYFPDFLLDDGKTIIEIKGYFTDKVQEKTNLAISLGYDIKVLYKDDLEHVFDYVKTHYSKDFVSLYDASKSCG